MSVFSFFLLLSANNPMGFPCRLRSSNSRSTSMQTWKFFASKEKRELDFKLELENDKITCVLSPDSLGSWPNLRDPSAALEEGTMSECRKLILFLVSINFKSAYNNPQSFPCLSLSDIQPWWRIRKAPRTSWLLNWILSFIRGGHVWYSVSHAASQW